MTHLLTIIALSPIGPFCLKTRRWLLHSVFVNLLLQRSSRPLPHPTPHNPKSHGTRRSCKSVPSCPRVVRTTTLQRCVFCDRLRLRNRNQSDTSTSKDSSWHLFQQRLTPHPGHSRAVDLYALWSMNPSNPRLPTRCMKTPFLWTHRVSKLADQARSFQPPPRTPLIDARTPNARRCGLHFPACPLFFVTAINHSRLTAMDFRCARDVALLHQNVVHRRAPLIAEPAT